MSYWSDCVATLNDFFLLSCGYILLTDLVGSLLESDITFNIIYIGSIFILSKQNSANIWQNFFLIIYLDEYPFHYKSLLIKIYILHMLAMRDILNIGPDLSLEIVIVITKSRDDASLRAFYCETNSIAVTNSS